jgi:hypothetical protein
VKFFLQIQLFAYFIGFSGHLYGNLPDFEIVNKVPLDTVCARLIQLLQDDDQDVRAKVAKALSYLVIV